MSKTKIVVLKLKELIYTAVFVCLGILLLLLLILMFSSRKKGEGELPSTATAALYHAGVYTSGLTLNDTHLSLEIVCDADHINSVRLVNLEESVTTMYPLLGPALEELELQLVRGVAPEELTLTESSRYTQTFLIEMIEQTLQKALRE